MMFWLQHDADRPLAIRAAGDPLNDFDVVPEYWDRIESRWVADPELADEMFWNPSIRSASEADVNKVISAAAAYPSG